MEQLLTQFSYFSNLLQRTNKEQAQGKILRILKHHGELSQKILTHCLQVRAASLSELLTKLENKGFIVRTVNTQDKRIFNIALTHEGHKEAEMLEKQNDEKLEKIFSDITETERTQLSAIMFKLIDSIDDSTDTEGSDFCEECGLCVYGYKRLAGKLKI